MRRRTAWAQRTLTVARFQSSRPADALPSVDASQRPSLIVWLDDKWSTAFENVGIPHFGFIDSGAAWLQVIEQSTGFGWAGTLAGCGFLVRGFTLIFSLRGDRASARMANAVSELAPVSADFNRVFRSKTASQVEIMEAGERLRAARNELFERHGTSNLQVMQPLIGSPFFMLGLASVLRVCDEAPRSLAAAHFMGLPLLAPDPTGLVALAAVATTLINIELTFRRRRSGANAASTSAVMAYMPIAVRALACLCVPLAMQFKVGTLLYWCGMGLAGLAQPALMSSASFRQWFGVPDVRPRPPNRLSPEDVDAELRKLESEMNLPPGGKSR